MENNLERTQPSGPIIPDESVRNLNKSGPQLIRPEDRVKRNEAFVKKLMQDFTELLDRVFSEQSFSVEEAMRAILKAPEGRDLRRSDAHQLLKDWCVAHEDLTSATYDPRAREIYEVIESLQKEGRSLEEWLEDQMNAKRPMSEKVVTLAGETGLENRMKIYLDHLLPSTQRGEAFLETPAFEEEIQDLLSKPMTQAKPAMLRSLLMQRLSEEVMLGNALQQKAIKQIVNALDQQYPKEV